MPVIVDGQLRRMESDEFAAVAYDVMACIFAIHREWGRLFDEQVYQREIARRLDAVQIEVPIDVSFGDFRKIYFMDLVVQQGAVIELKTVDKLTSRHQSQLLNYLLLAEVPRGKLVNLRPESIQHEFVNTSLTRRDRINFFLEDSAWDASESAAAELQRYTIALLNELGTGLDLSLYEEAITHFLGGDEAALHDVDIVGPDCRLGLQKVRCAQVGIGIEITALPPENRASYENHLQRFLKHTSLLAIHWINISRPLVSFKTLRRESKYSCP